MRNDHGSGEAVQPLSAVPLYRQLSQALQAEIAKGRWNQGDRIASESELSAMFSVSRITVRAALDELVEDGILVRIQGKGTFVTKSIGKRLLPIGSLSFGEMCRQNNIQPDRIVLEKVLLEATETDITKLHLKKGDKVVRLRRLLCADNTPIILANDHIHPDFAFLLEEELEGKSLNAMMINSGTIREIRSAERTVEICMATIQEAELMKVNPGSAMLLLRDLATDENGNPIRYTKEVIAGDRVRLEYATR